MTMILRPEQIELLALGLPVIPANDSGGGSSQPAVTSQTVTQNSISPEQAPYFNDIMARTQAVSETPYQPYQGQRVAGLTPMEQEGHQAVANMQSDPYSLQQGLNNTQSAAQQGQNLTQFDSQYIGSNYNPQQVSMFNKPGQVGYDFSPNDFGSQQAQQYMNPYIGSVIDSSLGEMDRRHAIDQVGMDSQAAQAGAFGGSRAALMKSQNDHDYNNEVNNFIGQQYSQAYGNAQQQFNQDRGAQMSAAQQRLGAGEFNVGTAMDYGKTGVGVQQYNEGQRQNAAQLNLQGQIANQQNRVAAAGVQAQGANILGSMGNQQANIAGQQQNMALQRASAQSQMGGVERGLNQQADDIAAQEFANQRDQERNNLAFYSGMMRGSAPSMINTATSNSQSNGNNMAQMLGLGLGGLGAYQAYNKIGG
jgi:hypothetical protein